MRTTPASVIVRKNAHRPAPTPRRGGCSATLSGFRSWPGRVCDDAVSASIAEVLVGTATLGQSRAAPIRSHDPRSGPLGDRRLERRVNQDLIGPRGQRRLRLAFEARRAAIWTIADSFTVCPTDGPRVPV